jgi:hypothetical protein
MKAGRDITQLVEQTKQVMPNKWSPPNTLEQSSQQWREEKQCAATIAKDSIERSEKR